MPDTNAPLDDHARRGRWADEIRRRLAALNLAAAREREIVDELAQHLEDSYCEAIAGGASPEDAARRALAEFDVRGLLGQRMSHLRQAHTVERPSPGRSTGSWLRDFVQDLSHARRIANNGRSLTALAIATLVLGIGANAAIFAVWNGLLHQPLAGVERPEELLMLSDPNAAGLLRGRSSGPRQWFSASEFARLRAHATGFSMLMASQSSLSVWPVRIGGDEAERISGRLVSKEFFDVLGVRPFMGRVFSSADSSADAAAVISHALWRRRFGSQADVLGETLHVGNVPVAIIGVAPPEFAGETMGERPDLWLPLHLQPLVLPGSNWLQDQPPDTVMWLHIFGRLAPGVTPSQAEEQANAVFQAGLAAFYGPGRPLDRLHQRINVRPGTRGASPLRDHFSRSLAMLFAAAAVLLFIACLNLASLLGARAVARHHEMAVRISLGASRSRLMRQLITEHLALAAVAGAAAIAVASIMHGGLVRMLQEAEPRFAQPFTLTPALLVFVAGAALTAALTIGLLSSFQLSRITPAAVLRGEGRGSAGSVRQKRSGRWLVGTQLTFSVPLLVIAGLLAQTVHNLNRRELGFTSERLVMARVTLGALVQDVPRRDRVLRDLHARLRQLPGVEAATFSQLGIFAGGISTAVIEVTGDPRRHDAALDRVGAEYFTTLRIPLLRGRDISERDRADSPAVCVVNDAFARAYFAGRDPIGLNVTTIDDGIQTPYQVVGVAGDARTADLRDNVEARFFVPAEQRRSQGATRTFLVRARAREAGLAAAIRNSVRELDPALASSLEVTTFEQQMAPLTADDRISARLATVFGAVALLITALGLYGVLSGGVVQRAHEIAVRIALGAPRRRLATEVVRESALVAAGGLLVGTMLAMIAARVIASRLFGVAPHDPLILAAAAVLLLVVALAAAAAPARRATRVDALVSLRQR
jgi:predicted permease